MRQGWTLQPLRGTVSRVGKLFNPSRTAETQGIISSLILTGRTPAQRNDLPHHPSETSPAILHPAPVRVSFRQTKRAEKIDREPGGELP